MAAPWLIWIDITPVSVTSEWRDDSWLASMGNQNRLYVRLNYLASRLWSHQLWSMWNHLRTGHGNCAANLHKWWIASSEECSCGQPQTVMMLWSRACWPNLPMISSYNYTVDDNVVTWLRDVAVQALATTKLPFYLRQTTHECVYFQSHDKDGRHTIWSTTAENPMLHTNIMDLCSIEPDLLPTEVLYCRNREFTLFLLLWAWPWFNDLHVWTLPIFPEDVLADQKWTFCISVTILHIFHIYTVCEFEFFISPSSVATCLRWGG